MADSGTVPTASPAATTRLWRRALQALRGDGKPCVLHGDRDGGLVIESDVDCLFPSTFLPRELARRLAAVGLTVVKHVAYEATGHSFVVAERDDAGQWSFLQLDAASDFRYSLNPRLTGRVFFTEAELQQARRAGDEYDVLEPAAEFGYLLVKRIAKGRLTERHERWLSRLFREDESGCRVMLARFWGTESSARLAHAAEDEDWTAVADRVGELRRELLRRTAVSAPLRTAEYWLRDVGRLWRRWRQPTGFHVVLLGADGSGKSTAGRLAAEALAPAFASVKVEHLGPRLFRRSRDAGPVPEPHAEPPRSVLRSCAQLGYWAVDYTAGYWLRIRPRLVRDQALFYDRYLLDALVDPQRYRSAAPRWAVAAVWRCVPKPDLVVLLDAPAVVLQARKAEVPFDECARQREAYRTLVAGLPNGRIIDAAAPLEQVVSSLVDAVIAALAERTARRLALPASAPPCRANAPLTEPSHG